MRVDPGSKGRNGRASSTHECLTSGDIVLQISRSLHPLDLISLGATNRVLNSFMKAKIVWIQAAESFCDHNVIPRSWYPLKDLSLEELQTLVLSPSRFLRLVEKQHTKLILPPLTRTFRPWNRAKNDWHTTETIHLSPGGRWLVTISTVTDANDLPEVRVCLWDLGVGGGGKIKVSPVASSIFPTGFDIKEVDVSSNGEGLLIVGSFCPNEDGPRIARVYEICPGSAVPTFNVRAELDIGDYDEAAGIGVDNDTITFLSSERVMLWNFVEDTLCSWKVEAITFITVVNGQAIAVESGASANLIHVYDLPAFEPVVGHSSAGVISISLPVKHTTKCTQGWDNMAYYMIPPRIMDRSNDTPALVMMDFREEEEEEGGWEDVDSDAESGTDEGEYSDDGDSDVKEASNEKKGDKTGANEEVPRGFGAEMYLLKSVPSDFPRPSDGPTIASTPTPLVAELHHKVANFAPSTFLKQGPPEFNMMDAYSERHLFMCTVQGHQATMRPTMAITAVATSEKKPTFKTIFINPFGSGLTDLRVHKCVFCPLSGRAVAVNHGNSRHNWDVGDEFIVMDFILPPSQS